MPEIESNYCTLNTQAGRVLGEYHAVDFGCLRLVFSTLTFLENWADTAHILIQRMRHLRIIR